MAMGIWRCMAYYTWLDSLQAIETNSSLFWFLWLLGLFYILRAAPDSSGGNWSWDGFGDEDDDPFDTLWPSYARLLYLVTCFGFTC